MRKRGISFGFGIRRFLLLIVSFIFLVVVAGIIIIAGIIIALGVAFILLIIMFLLGYRKLKRFYKSNPKSKKYNDKNKEGAVVIDAEYEVKK